MIHLNSNNYANITYKDQMKRDALLILPGGGYHYASKREAEPVMHAFNDLNLHMVIYQYRETLLTYPDVLCEGKSLLQQLSQDPLIDKIHVIGFSAGGHLALMLLTNYDQYFRTGILCYPVVSSDKAIYHGGSFKQLIGHLDDKVILQKLSMEKHVHKDMPPTFIFHTMDDQAVPVENAVVLIDQLHKVGVYVEAHLFPKGRHGVSVVTRETPFDEHDVEGYLKAYGYIHQWVHLAKSFIERHMI